jgi:hypothetical protein
MLGTATGPMFSGRIFDVSGAYTTAFILMGVDGPIGAAHQGCKRAVVTDGIQPVDALVLNAAYARAEAQAHHREGGEVDLGVAMGVGVSSSISRWS